jgi:hypothetical protein
LQRRSFRGVSRSGFGLRSGMFQVQHEARCEGRVSAGLWSLYT